MNELNKTDTQSIDSSQKKAKKSPTPDMVKSFSDLFKTAENKLSKIENEPKVEKKPSQNSDNAKSTSNDEQPIIKELTLKKDDPNLKQLFQEMGINNVNQIETIIIQVSKSVEESVKTPSVQQNFLIKLESNQLKLSIKSTSQKNGYIVNLTCDKSLIGLLNAHLPELKNYLKRKNINIEELHLNEDDNDDQKKDKKKNKI